MLAAITEAETKQNKKLLLIQPNRADIDSADALFLQKALQVVEENMQDRNFGVEQFCEKMGMSRHRLFVKIEALARVTLAEFIREVRLKRAAKLLLQNEQSISEVASLVGFSDPRYFRKCFKEQFGVAPANFVERNSKNLPPNSKNLPLG